MGADVGAWHQAEAADKGGTEVGDNAAVEVFHHHHVVLVGVHYQLHAGVVDDVLAVGDLGILLGHLSTAAQKQAIAHLHDVGFVDGVHAFALLPPRESEGKTGNPGGSFFRDDLQRFHHSGHH